MIFPTFFGDPDRPLYGVYHGPEGADVSDVGVVLCHPILHEYADSRRAVASLAERLAGAGHHVMRFDYHGTGDSADAGDDADVATWRDDIGSAIDELVASRGLASVGLVGLRFGATLAAQVAALRSDVRFLVLWEPILDGRAYLDDLRELHDTWLDYESDLRPGARAHARTDEILGHPFSSRLAEGLSRADLADLTMPSTGPVLMVDEGTSDRIGPLARRLQGAGTDVQHLALDGGRVWQREMDARQAQVPRAVVSAIVDWIGGDGSR